MLKATPRRIEWTCQLLEWHGLYQHPHAKNKDMWFVYLEHAIANAGDEVVNQWAFMGRSPSYTSDVIKKIIEDDTSIAPEDRIVEIRCLYECSNYRYAEDGELCLMVLGAENGPDIEGYGRIDVKYVGGFDAETREYVWHPGTAIDEALVLRYFHHVPTHKELNYMCREGELFGVDELCL